MEKFEILGLGGKKKKEDVKKPEAEDTASTEVVVLEQAVGIKKELGDIVRGRDLESLDLEELKVVLGKYKEIENVLGITSEKRMEGAIREQMDTAKEIMGNEFFGTEEIEKAFGIKMKPEDIPEIPFSKEDLERAKELKQFLVLRVDKAPDGKPLSLVKMNEILKGEVSDGTKLLYSSDGPGIKGDSWYRNEDFIKDETPKLSWALTSKEVIPNSTSKNYFNQTEELAGYAKNQVFKDKEIPEEYQEAIDEFEKEKSAISGLMSSDWKVAAEKLSNLKINKLMRQNPSEVLYDMTIYFQNRGERILEKMYTWTSSRASGGELVLVGHFASGGAGVLSGAPGHSRGDLGVSFSRSL